MADDPLVPPAPPPSSSATGWRAPDEGPTLADVEHALEASDAMLGFPATCGLLAAVVSAPRAIPASTWLDMVKGEHEFDDPAQIEGFTRGLQALREAVRESLASHGANCCPGPDQPQAVREFCQGYAGIASQDATWENDERAFAELLPMFALGGFTSMDEVAKLLPSAAEDPESWLKKAREGLPQTLSALYAYWAARRPRARVELPRAQQVRRAEHKAGRNDPCPCGSGKKFKRCCG